jgi:hypothetical protein
MSEIATFGNDWKSDPGCGNPRELSATGVGSKDEDAEPAVRCAHVGSP